MIGVQISKSDIDALCKELTKLGKIIVSPNLQLHRANAFRKYTIDMVSKGMLDLKPISEATKIIDKGDHNPEWHIGTLARMMAVRPVKGNAADAGYFGGGAKPAGKKKTYTQIAILQHTGFRIPAMPGDKNSPGQKVRNWFMAQGIFLKQSTHWINVSPRPWMFQSYFAYIFSGEDIKATDAFLNKLINSPYSDPTKVDTNDFELESQEEE